MDDNKHEMVMVDPTGAIKTEDEAMSLTMGTDVEMSSVTGDEDEQAIEIVVHAEMDTPDDDNERPQPVEMLTSSGGDSTKQDVITSSDEVVPPVSENPQGTHVTPGTECDNQGDSPQESVVEFVNASERTERKSADVLT